MQPIQPLAWRAAPRRVVVRAATVFCLILVGATPALAGSGDAAVDAALASWDVLAKNVKVSGVKQKTVDGVTVGTAKARAFGHRVDLEARYQGTDLHRLGLTFTPERQLKSDDLVALLGVEPGQALPSGVGAGFGVKRLEVDFANRKPVAIRAVFDAGTWAPFGGRDMRLSDLEVSITLFEPFGARSLEVYLSGTSRIPAKLAKYLGLGETRIDLTGFADSRAKTLLLTVDLATDEIPLGDTKTVVLKGAQLRLGFLNAAPILAIGGTLGVRPARGGPLTLKGDVALKLTGEVFAQGWNDGTWSNPLGLSDRLHVLRPGVGFGADFSAVPWPMPILAIQGGIAVGADPARPRFGGQVLVGVHGGDPTQNVIDARLDRVNALDLVRPFVADGMPGALGEVLAGLEVTNGRLTVVPPGPGVTLFGVYYPPGFQIAGDVKAGSFHGELDVDVSPLGIEAFAQVTPITFPGFSLTGAGGAPGPYLYVVAKQGTKALALNGTLDVLGIKRAADISVSRHGFSATVSGSLFGVAQAEVEVAGRNPLKDDGGLFVSATMGSQLNRQLMDAVVARIDEHVAESRRGFAKARADLERERARLIAADKLLNEARERAVRELKQKCQGFRDSDRDRQRKKADKDRLDRRISGLESDIASLRSKIAGAKGYAKRTKRTINAFDCGRGQVWDPIHGGGCYSCPAGMSRDTTIHIEHKGACSKSTVSWDAQVVKKTGELAAARGDRDIVQRALAGLERAVDRTAEQACKTMADATAIDRLPAVRGIVEEHAGINAAIDAAQGIVSGGELVTMTTVSTAKWLAQRGGEVAGIFQLKKAGFEGCLSKTSDGRLALEIDGVFAGQAVRGSFDVNLRDLKDGARKLADALFKTGKTPPAASNGACKRPNVPRVTRESVRVVDRVTKLREGKRTDRRAKAKTPERPGWAPNRSQAAANAQAAGKSRRGRTKAKDPKKTPHVDAAGRCRELVQGRIPYDPSGRQAWPAADLTRLCSGTADGEQPGSCYTLAMSGRLKMNGRAWQPAEAIALCAGTSNARETVRCFVDKSRALQDARALKACSGQ